MAIYSGFIKLDTIWQGKSDADIEVFTTGIVAISTMGKPVYSNIDGLFAQIYDND